jgi:5-formaminoimidazole-4-carboxamide-1-beta-D-ribofuranosyl 5'-monophosphate synthetase
LKKGATQEGQRTCTVAREKLNKIFHQMMMMDIVKELQHVKKKLVEVNIILAPNWSTKWVGLP